MRTLLILTVLALGAFGAEPDVAAIRAELHAAIEDRKTDDDSFARKLEAWYAAFGQTISIDHPREHSIYIFGLSLATAPDADLPKILQQIPGVSDRRGILAYCLTKNDLTTMPFDKALWSQQPAQDHLRYRLFKSFLSEHPPMGRTRADIETILGPPDSSYADGFTYALGSDLSGIGIDSLWVELTLKDGKVSEYRFRSD